jgi:tetratricopeptide (TPR) repeat protein
VLCAKAERSPQALRLSLAQEAAACCQRLEELSPLGDRFARQTFAACRFDIAMVAEDAAAMLAEAQKLPQPVDRQVSSNLAGATQRRRVLLNVKAVFQKQDRCLPTSIAAVAGTFGRTIDADELAKLLTYNGTPMWRALSWLRQNGYVAKVFILTPELCSALLNNGAAFVYTFNTSLDNSHATAAVGIDEAAGLLLYHDPAGERFGRILLKSVGECEQPLGPWALAFAPPDKAATLDCIGPDDAELGELCQQFWHAMAQRDTGALASIVERMERQWPASSVTAAFKAQRQMLTTELAAGIAAIERLCAQHPKSVELQRMLLGGLSRTRDTARIREFLGEIVSRGRIPGISDVLPWSFPPSSCVARLADLQGLTAEGAPAARKLLLRLLERDPSCAMAYHALGDVCLRQGQLKDAQLPYKVASLLGHTDEHFARAAFDCCRLLGEGEDGLAYLSQRVERLGRLVEGAPPWATLITAREDCGDISGALAAAHDALAARPDDAELLVFLVRFWLRMGEGEKTQALLEQLEKGPSRPRYLEAAVHYYRAKGQWQRALELCEEWAAQTPDSVDAHRMLASLMRNRQTIFEVAKVAESWARQRPDDEEFEFIQYDQLRASYRDENQEAFVRLRLKRNPQDAWAWRELGHILVGRCECLAPSRRGELLPQVEEAVAAAKRLAPNDAATAYLSARLAEMQGRWEECIELLLGGLRVEPESGFAYGRAWENSANLPLAAQEDVLQKLQERLLLSVGPLHHARNLALSVASRLGWEYALRLVRQWKQHRPGDPELIEAYVDVLLEHGRGRTDAAEAITELQEALKRYPQHFDLRISLAHAYGRMLQDDSRRQILSDALKSWPLDSRVRISLAADMMAARQHQAAIELLREGTLLSPQDPACVLQLARAQYDSGDAPSATATLKAALELLPEDVAIRRQLVRWVNEAGDTPAALEIVRGGLKLYPESAVFWHMLADTMINGQAGYDVKEAEAALRRALEGNYAYYDAADVLAWLLGMQHRFDEARAVIRDIMPTLPNAAPAQGRLAWLTWISGLKRQAVDELAAVTAAHPDYRWGWWSLMQWLEELEAPDLTCRLLENMPPAVLTDPDITARRLDLLGKAQLSRDKLDAMWAQALEDFPRNEDLLERRFDVLADRDAWDEARELMRRMETSCGQSPYILYRKIAIAAHDKDVPAVVGAALGIFRTSGVGNLQAATWRLLVQWGLYLPAAQAVLDEIAADKSFDVAAVCSMIDHAEHLESRPSVMRWLADRMLKCQWDLNHMVLGAALEDLNLIDRRYVKRFLSSNESLCRSHTRLWAAIGHHLATGNDPLAIVDWISDWRQRQGVEMIAVSYYRLSFGARPGSRWSRLANLYVDAWLALGRRPGGLRSSAGADWLAIYEASRDALERLPEDKTLLMHVTALCEALLALGRMDEFLQAVDRYRNLLQTTDKRFWLPAFYTREKTPFRMCLLADLLRCQSRAKAAEIFCRLSQRPRQPVIYRAAVGHVGRWFGYLSRLALSEGLTKPPKG